MPIATPLHLTATDRRKLLCWSRRLGRQSRLRRRAAIVLRAAKGWSNERIARDLNTDAHTVARWRRRFEQSGLAGIKHERARSGRPRHMLPGQEAAAVLVALKGNPPDADRWSLRTLARYLGMSHSRVARFLRREGMSTLEF